jgi:hypothetical protein
VQIEPVQALPVEAAPAQVLGYKSARRNAADKPDLDVEKLTKQTLPLWLLTGGLLIEGVMTFLRAKWWSSNPNKAYLHFLLNVGFSTAAMTAGVVIAARFRQIPIGSLPSAVLRLSALIIASDAVSDMLAPAAMFIPFGGIALLLVNFAVYFSLLGTLFDLDEGDTWYCICIIFILHVGLYFGMGLLWKWPVSIG